MGTKRSSLTEVADDENERLAAVDEFVGGGKTQEASAPPPPPPKVAWATPSIQMTEEHLSLIRAVAQARAGKGRVSISAVVQKLIDDNREALMAEVAERQKSKTA